MMRWKVFFVCLIVVYSVAILGSIFTSGNVNSPWYESIKPSITPPNYVFPIVWNILFFFIALSLYLAWTSKKLKKKDVALAFGINLFLNVLWSFLFFYLQNPRLAFYEIFILLASIIWMIFVTWKEKKSSLLLLPYLIWVSFATFLNYIIAF